MNEQMTNILLLFGGAQVAVTALIGFLGKIWINYLHEQHKGEFNVQIEKVKSELQKTHIELQASLNAQLHVHKVQFEKELQVYEEIWASLIEVRKETTKLRPLLDHINPEESEEERKRKRLVSFGEAFQVFLDKVNKERPFYAQEVYEKLQELIDLVQTEAIEYQHLKGDSADYWKKAMENSKQINELIETSCERIRSRIAKISVT